MAGKTEQGYIEEQIRDEVGSTVELVNRDSCGWVQATV